jgi:hypothetical protein
MDIGSRLLLGKRQPENGDNQIDRGCACVCWNFSEEEGKSLGKPPLTFSGAPPPPNTANSLVGWGEKASLWLACEWDLFFLPQSPALFRRQRESTRRTATRPCHSF